MPTLQDSMKSIKRSSFLQFWWANKRYKIIDNQCVCVCVCVYGRACVHVHAKSLQSCLTLWDLWTVTHQGPLSMGFSRQEYWSE